MERYNYYDAIREDVQEYLTENYDLSEFDSAEDLAERLEEDCWTADSVTGNASGSYTFNAWRAEEYVAHNLDLLAEALREFGYDDVNVLEKGAEWCDVTIRCYLLYGAVADVVEELKRAGAIAC